MCCCCVIDCGWLFVCWRGGVFGCCRWGCDRCCCWWCGVVAVVVDVGVVVVVVCLV